MRGAVRVFVAQPCADDLRGYSIDMRQRTICLLFLTACGAHASSTPAETTPAASSEAAAVPAESTATKMWHHFWDVMLARNEVIRGNLEAARRPLARLAQGEFDEQLPVSWAQWVTQMQTHAERGVSATSLEELADVVADVSAQCADCHRATRGGPKVEVESMDYVHDLRGLEGVMARHAWAADEMWVGMTVPSYPSWVRGARALADFPVPEMDVEEDEAGPDITASLDAIREIGTRAEAAGKPFEQVAVYGDLIARCGSCHQALGLSLEDH